MIELNSVKKLSVNGLSIKQLWINGTQVFKDGYKNWVPYAIDTDGSIYNGIGYKTGYRIRSGGAEAAQTGACHTGFIPVLPGAIVRLTGWNFSFNDSSNAVNFSDGSFTNLGQFTQQPSGYGICANAIPTVTIKNNVYQFTVPNNTSIRYIRVTGQHAYNTLPPEMIITINEEIE
jgi:hypothetical protein